MRLPIVELDGVPCADPGVVAVANFPVYSFQIWVVWLGIVAAADRLVATLTMLPRLSWNQVVVHPKYVPSLVLIALWNVFTAFSIIFVSTTMRSSLAVIFKASHVIVEALILVQLLLAHQMRTFAAVALVAILAIGGFVLSFPCTTTITTAAIGGLVLDTSNFIGHLIVGFQQPAEWFLWQSIFGFGLHARYLLMYVGVQRWNISLDAKGNMRIAGMLFNNLAIYVFLHLIRKAVLLKPGSYTLDEWKRARGPIQDATRPRVAWVGDESIVRVDREGGEQELGLLHAPGETAYTANQMKTRFLNAACIGCCHAARPSTSSTWRVYSWCFPWLTISSAVTVASSTTVTVPSFFVRDCARFAIVLTVASILWRI